jgi:hypothetical protein
VKDQDDPFSRFTSVKELKADSEIEMTEMDRIGFWRSVRWLTLAATFVGVLSLPEFARADVLCVSHKGEVRVDPSSCRKKETPFDPAAFSSATVEALEARVAELEVLLASASLENDGTVLRLTGVNVQIVSGSGATDAPVNGRGNLIVGYNENVSGQPRSGSHNLVVGPENGWTSFGGVVAGRNNRVSGPHATVSGGSGNEASADGSSVSGGSANRASGTSASVSGGASNVASNQFTSVSGGAANHASFSGSSVSGGWANEASEELASVCGGQLNMATGFAATVSGGKSNEASGDWASVSGGELNEASGDDSTVSGGGSNQASGVGASVSGGFGNVSSGAGASVSGGLSVGCGSAGAVCP